MVGESLGPYKIVEPLGAGGMGEVYLGEDTRLGRKVAIKVLPAEFASDPERLARFEQEARAAAALNHPHIAVVHDVGSEAAEDGTTTHFMVQEYLEGQSLKQRLDKGALRLGKALDLATEVGEALVAAHKAGIIHRDLKPDNIFVTEQGHAKVLDFGLAKLTEMAVPAGSQASMSPTTLGTVAGQVMGTAGYMAPEQVNGEAVDHRADLFAFGSVAYESLTGRQAFAGKSIPDTLSRILHDEPGPLSEVDESLPSELQRIVKKCLAKEPAKRYQAAADLVVDLQALGADVESGTAAPVGGQPVVAATEAHEAHWIHWGLAVALAVATGLVVALGVWLTIPSPPEPLTVIFDIEYPAGTTFEHRSTLGVAISPDGTSIVFNADRRLWLRAVDDVAATPIRGTEGARVPFFSPDGQQLGFWTEGQIKSISSTGGAPVSLGSAPDRVHGASWADDGFIYFGQGREGIFRVAENGGEPELVVAMEGGELAQGPQLLPGGEWLLYTRSGDSRYGENGSIVARPISGGEPVVLVAEGTDGRYVSTGHIVYFLDYKLFAVPFDADDLEVTGGSVSVVEGVWQATSPTRSAQYAFSDRGGLVYLPGRPVTNTVQLAWVDRNGQVETLPFEPRDSVHLDLSPDGRRIALQVRGTDNESVDIWIYDVERGGSQVRLTGGGINATPVWAPDGEWIFFASDRGGNLDIWKQRADRGLDAELVLDMEARVLPTSISADGKKLLFMSGPNGGLDIGMLALDGDPEPEMIVATDADEARGNFSPDGRFFAFHSNETGRYGVYVMEIESRRIFPVSTDTRGGFFARWPQDGGEIFWSSVYGGQNLLSAEVTLEPFSASEPVQISDVRRPFLTNFDVAADGLRLLVTVPVETGDDDGEAPDTPRIRVVLNWFEELRQRVPTGR